VLDRLDETLVALDRDEQAVVADGLHLGRVIDEHRAEFGPGDFLLRSVLGADHERGAVAVASEVPLGSTVQFHVRDATTAHDDLATALSGRRAHGALVFTCTGRGSALFGVPDHDAVTIADTLDAPAVAGLACAGEIGPVGGANHSHTMSTSVLLLG
jgi:small ligand-binding sensory domain FIST